MIMMVNYQYQYDEHTTILNLTIIDEADDCIDRHIEDNPGEGGEDNNDNTMMMMMIMMMMMMMMIMLIMMKMMMTMLTVMSRTTLEKAVRKPILILPAHNTHHQTLQHHRHHHRHCHRHHDYDYFR